MCRSSRSTEPSPCVDVVDGGAEPNLRERLVADLLHSLEPGAVGRLAIRSGGTRRGDVVVVDRFEAADEPR